MLKKVLCTVLLCLAIVGCGNVKNNNEKIDNKNQLEKYSLNSSNGRLVFKKDNNYEIVYFENEKIIKVESAIKFETEAEAKKYFLEESYGNSNVINRIYDVFIIEQVDDYWEDYKSLSSEELKNYYKQADFEYVIEEENKNNDD